MSGRDRIARWLAAAAAAVTVGLFAPVAVAQVCETNQAQLTQAVTDSQSALDRVSATLDEFGRAMISPRSGPVDATAVISARGNLDSFVSALSEFSAQVGQIGQSCGPQFATEAQAISNLVNRFQGERSRADQLIADHQVLVDSGEPPMTQAQMEGVQGALLQRGFYQGGVDGRFGVGTRGAIAAYQGSIGQPQTGFLKPEQLAQLTGGPAVASSAPPPVDGLPPAPDITDGTASPAGAGPVVVDDEAQRICAQNIAEVNNAVTRTRTFRDQMAGRVAAFRAAARGPRVPPIDDQAGARINAEIDAYIQPLEAFHDQADAVVGQCGDAFDDSFATLTGQLQALGAVQDRTRQLNDDYQALLESGEPAMAEATMREVQTGLGNLGHYAGAIDAVYGPGTRRAITAYQDSIGSTQTGYLTNEQIAALRQAAVAPPPPDPTPPTPPPAPTPPPPAPEIPAETPALAVGIDAAREQVTRDLVQRQPPLPLSAVRPGDGRFGELWWQARDDLARGQHQQMVDRRLALFGAAYLGLGADSVAMVDAHLVIADGFARLGLFGDAAFHIQRAADLWATLDRDSGRERAILLERLAAARLAQALSSGALDAAGFDDLERLLTEARAAAQGDPDSDDLLKRTILERLADAHVAADRRPDDSEIAAVVDARYGE